MGYPATYEFGQTAYQSTFGVSSYRRPLIQRLTPLAYFCIGLFAVFTIACASLLLNQAAESTNGTELLSSRVKSPPEIVITYYKPVSVSTVVQSQP